LEVVDGRLHCEELGLDLVVEGERLRFFDPVSGEFLRTPGEEAAERKAEKRRADREAHRADEEAAEREAERYRAEEAMLRAEDEAAARAAEAHRADKAEAEIARLRAELDALRRRNDRE
jgi:hypothetical protein